MARGSDAPAAGGQRRALGGSGGLYPPPRCDLVVLIVVLVVRIDQNDRMRIAVISDVHGNLFALEAVLAAIEGDGVDVTVDRGRADVAFAVRTGRVA
ncbi:hypothetical protein AMIS_41590 [Actinoplanes missouriensis 431]|uniref:Calcineurin-like phosphoesterase domain-containing protein n=1 Tax=Actinoplanes missouriensis (strain ATCC 14538 / DSM 43046 / CBS 188.64 / JCM 3121 / NBRC 102363 / NCIMB 12654 / NRRL B-3342 / UNCC 431) TaxID=512565 RepID=I0H8P2_ACTM4|nr:hypothetical protein AMIS_41590 [Actinoplanes missouriensis 431]